MQGPFYPSNRYGPKARKVVVQGLGAGKLDRDKGMCNGRRDANVR